MSRPAGQPEALIIAQTLTFLHASQKEKGVKAVIRNGPRVTTTSTDETTEREREREREREGGRE